MTILSIAVITTVLNASNVTNLKVSKGEWSNIPREVDVSIYKSHDTRFFWELSARLDEVKKGKIDRGFSARSDYMVDRIIVAEYKNNHDMFMLKLENPSEGRNVSGEQGGLFFTYAIYLYEKYTENNWYSFTPAQAKIAKMQAEKIMSAINGELKAGGAF